MIAEKIFAEKVASGLKQYFSSEYEEMECKVTEQYKNNGITKVGIEFRMPGKRTGVVLYIKPFYEAVQQGKTLKEILCEIAEKAEEAIRLGERSEFLNVKEYGKAKEFLTVGLVNTKANQRMLAGMPHREIEDLSLIYMIRFPMPETEGSGKAKIDNKLMEQWNISEKELYRDAMENVQRKETPVLKNMGTVAVEMATGEESTENLFYTEKNLSRHPEELFYILTNREKSQGAATILHPGVLEKISGLFPEGFYILPSSIHELLILPKNEMVKPKELGKMVREVNQSQLTREEILSDRIYEYDRERGKIRQVPKSIEKGREMKR